MRATEEVLAQSIERFVSASSSTQVTFGLWAVGNRERDPFGDTFVL
jgi:hypothetical protein